AHDGRRAPAPGAGGGPAGDRGAEATACLAGVDAADRAVRAANRGGEVGATTLLVGLVTVAGEWAVARVGDGTALVLGPGGWDDVLAPAGGEVAGEAAGLAGGGLAGVEGMIATATAALPSPAPAVELAEGRLGPRQALVLVTDGVADPLRDGPETVAPALAGALVTPPAPLDLAALVDFSRHGCHDDRTLLGVWRRPAPGETGDPASFGA
ncbi:MAG: protein phosphatase 2C domain-containing protein, partial [Acidimicrobiales bacterium]